MIVLVRWIMGEVLTKNNFMWGVILYLKHSEIPRIEPRSVSER
jgi:hypothetical protein